jgi:hypothetical protein
MKEKGSKKIAHDEAWFFCFLREVFGVNLFLWFLCVKMVEDFFLLVRRKCKTPVSLVLILLQTQELALQILLLINQRRCYELLLFFCFFIFFWQ